MGGQQLQAQTVERSLAPTTVGPPFRNVDVLAGSPERRRTKMKLRKKTGSTSCDRVAVKRRLLVETLCDRRVLAALHGVVFDDIDHSWRMESGETALSNRLVFIDSNNNQLPDDGERYHLTDDEGSFVFDELGGDEQIVRLLALAPTQNQHFPVAIDSLVDNRSIDLTESDLFKSAFDLKLLGPVDAVLSADTGLIHVDANSGAATDVELGARPTGSALLPDGRLLVLANDLDGGFAFIVDGGVKTTVDLLNAGNGNLDVIEPFAGWASVSIDANGYGVLVPVSPDGSPVELRQVIFGEEIVSVGTSVLVSEDTQVFGGGKSTSIISQKTEDGLALWLWSNSTATPIHPNTVTIPGAESVLGYSDDTGLVFTWVPGTEEESPSIKVLDADAQFAVLQTIVDLDDLVAVDIGRSVIFTMSSSTPVLRAVDAITSATIARWELISPMLQFDQPSEMAIAPGGDELLILVAGGLATISLTSADAHRVRTDATAPLFPLRFAANVVGENTPPRFQSPPSFVTVQGDVLILADGALKQDAVDDDEDPFVVVRASAPSNGTARITPGGGLTYTPNFGFVGTDSFQVFLHDGRGASELTTIEITVVPLVDPAPELVITVNPVPERALPGFVAGTIQTIGLGSRPVILSIDDPRFIVINNTIVLAPGSGLDYEQEGLVTATLTASDPMSGAVLTTNVFTVTVVDENDPITDVQPRSATVLENQSGETLATLVVTDQDANEQFVFEVFDDRFEFTGNSLKLKDGVSLDYEAQSEIVLNIVVTDTRGGQPFSFEFIVTVIDVEEPIEAIHTITLSGNTVVEYARGAVVGAVMINGQLADENFVVSVDDSRFEIVDGQLKLREGVFLIRADQQDARVVITAYESANPSAGTSETFFIEVLANENPFHNPNSPYDVNGDDEVTPLDALLILNAISRNGGGGPISQFDPPGRYWDVNGDGQITPLDALLILNYLNVQNRPRPTGEPESGSATTPISIGSPDENSGDETLTPVATSQQTEEPVENLLQSPPVVGPLLDEVTRAGIFETFNQTRLQWALPSNLNALVPTGLRDFDYSSVISNNRLDLSQLRDQLVQLLLPSDWALLRRLEESIRRTPINAETIQAIDRALLAINSGWDAFKTS